MVNEKRGYTINTEEGSNFSAGGIYFVNIFDIGTIHFTSDLQALGGGEINPQDMTVSNIAGNFLIYHNGLHSSFTQPIESFEGVVHYRPPTRGLTIVAESGLIDNININYGGGEFHNMLKTSFYVNGRGWKQREWVPPSKKLTVGKNIKLDRVDDVRFNHQYAVIGDKNKNWIGLIKKKREETYSSTQAGAGMRWYLHIDPLFFSSSVFEKSPKAMVTFVGETFWDTGGTTEIEPILDFEGKPRISHSYITGQYFLGNTLLELKNGIGLGGSFVFSDNSRIKLLGSAKAYSKHHARDDYKMEVPIVRTKEEWEALSITEPNIISGGNDFHHQIIVGDNIDFGGETIETKEIGNQQKKFEIHGLGNKLSNFVVGGGGLFGENENETGVNNLKIDGKVTAKNPGQSGVGILHNKVGRLSLFETDIKSNVTVVVDDPTPQKHAYIGGVVGAIPKNGLGLSLNNSFNSTIRVLNKTKGNYEKNSGWDEIKTPIEKLGNPSSTKEEKEAAIEKITQFSDGLNVGRVASIENIGGIAGYITDVETSNVFNNNTLVNANISVNREGGIQKRMAIRELSKSAIESIHKQKKGGATVEGLPEDITSLEQKIEKIIMATDLGTNGDKVGGDVWEGEFRAEFKFAISKSAP